MYVLEEMTYEESEIKVIQCEVCTAMILNVAILAIFISIPIITTKFSPRVVLPDTQNDPFSK